ncbi:MAG: 6-phosphogluconate dehydrogenase (decarboxylating) [Acidimicrobiia bacterium]
MKIGIVGLGRMGSGMAKRLRAGGVEVVGYTRDPSKTEVPTLEALLECIDIPRVVITMLPAGEVTGSTIERLSELMDSGDYIVDGGNSYFGDSIERAKRLEQKGIRFVDAGISGGIWGAELGYCIMVGGDPKDVSSLEPVLRILATEGGFAHVGPHGAGHFVKMVHNGVEYAMIEAYAEGYELLTASPLRPDPKTVFQLWMNGSVIRSWLLELAVRALEESHDLADVRGWVEDSGEGRWTVETAVRLGVPAPSISEALYRRFVSRQEDSPAMRLAAALRKQFGGHAIKPAAPGGSSQADNAS